MKPRTLILLILAIVFTVIAVLVLITRETLLEIIYPPPPTATPTITATRIPPTRTPTVTPTPVIVLRCAGQWTGSLLEMQPELEITLYGELGAYEDTFTDSWQGDGLVLVRDGARAYRSGTRYTYRAYLFKVAGQPADRIDLWYTIRVTGGSIGAAAQTCTQGDIPTMRDYIRIKEGSVP